MLFRVLKIDPRGHHVRVWCGDVGLPEAAAEASAAGGLLGRWGVEHQVPDA